MTGKEEAVSQNIKEGHIQVPGGKVWYRIVGTDKQKPPLLTLHGGPGFPHDSLEVLETLADDRPVIFYDQLGCGKSDRPGDTSLWTLDRFLEELKQVRAALGLKEFHLLGHSWGSLLAAKYALQKPEGLLSLYLSGAFLSVPKWEEDTKQLVNQLPPATQKAVRTHEAAGTTDSQEYKDAIDLFARNFISRTYPLPDAVKRTIAGFNEQVYKTMWGPSEFYCDGNLKGYDLTQELHNIEIPVMLSCGRYDEARPETVREFRKKFKNADMVVFNNSAHRAYIDEPEAYVSVVRKFTAKAD